MKVFITWSGEKSRALAEIIRKWLPGVLQAVKPYFSPDDVAKGSRWYPEVAKELEASSVGLLCVTQENLGAPWLLFEAGALGKSLEKSRVCPLLFGLEPTDLTGPLSQFQGARFQRAEFKQVVKMINTQMADVGLPIDVLDSVFEMWWPKLEQEVTAKMAEADDVDSTQTRSDRDILEEILQLNRGIARDGRYRDRGISPAAIEDLVAIYSEMARASASKLSGATTGAAMAQFVDRLRRPVEHIARKSSLGRHGLGSLFDIFDEVASVPPAKPEESAGSVGDAGGAG